ncbi:LiaF transmembrane domain-containing protein [Bacillus solitudinis]|uniref:LiaF transmembrane domain-containing protein n=1 Tax=Bacillus solitudinis TaxID=2014074 RepID=UPI000C236BFB|nr:DUF5668 domain-containing protein [Bacillus solitudinis]
MKNQAIYPGMMLICIGMYFYLQSYTFPFSAQIMSWPSLLLVIGLCFLFQAYLSRDYQFIIPGWLLTGLAIHFHGLSLVNGWPNHWAIFTLILGLSFLCVYGKTKKDGLLLGILFSAVSLLMFTSFSPFHYLQKLFSVFGNLWPLILIALGLLFLYKHK